MRVARLNLRQRYPSIHFNLLILLLSGILQESEKFKKAFADPEFRSLLSEYMQEIQDPKHREVILNDLLLIIIIMALLLWLGK